MKRHGISRNATTFIVTMEKENDCFLLYHLQHVFSEGREYIRPLLSPSLFVKVMYIALHHPLLHFLHTLYHSYTTLMYAMLHCVIFTSLHVYLLPCNACSTCNHLPAWKYLTSLYTSPSLFFLSYGYATSGGNTSVCTCGCYCGVARYTYFSAIEVVTGVYFSKPMRLLHMSIFLSCWGCSSNIFLSHWAF